MVRNPGKLDLWTTSYVKDTLNTPKPTRHSQSFFVKKHLVQAKRHWVDIVDCRRYEMSPNNLHFGFVVGALYKRKIQPQYSSKSAYTKKGIFDECGYYSMIRAITWETAHKDIEQQKSKNAVPRKLKMPGVSYNKNRSNKDFFREDAPPEIMALANNLHDRTNPLWNKALKYVNKPEFVYEIKKVYLDQHNNS